MALQFNTAQSNRATPSYGTILQEVVQQPNKKFGLFNNILDGTFYPIQNDVWWSNELSDGFGELTTPIIFELTGLTEVQSLRLVGNLANSSYPVDFTFEVYINENLQYTHNVEDNAKIEYLHPLNETIVADKVTVTISKINVNNQVVQLSNVYLPHILKRSDILETQIDTVSKLSGLLNIHSSDNLHIFTVDAPMESEAYPVGEDIISLTTIEDSTVTNVHTKMKDTTRQVFGKVYVTYSNALTDKEYTIENAEEAYNSRSDQLSNGKFRNDNINYFTLYDNQLNGYYAPSMDTSEIGWVSNFLTDSNGIYTTPVTLKVNFTSRLINKVICAFDIQRNLYPINFDVVMYGDTIETLEVRNNTNSLYQLEQAYQNVTAIELIVYSMNKGQHPLIISDITFTSTVLYEGQDLMYMSLLEEISYDEGADMLGHISANEISIQFDNSNKDFYFNQNSAIAKQLKKNRRIEPHLGVKIGSTVEWYPLGVYWSYNWQVPMNDMGATVVGFDTLGLLDTQIFTEHYVYQNYSVGALFEVILQAAQLILPSLTYNVDNYLFNEFIPYAWFENESYMQALKRLASAGDYDVYCDRTGCIQCRPRLITETDDVLDVWSDNTNVITKNYPTLYSYEPNSVRVPITSIEVQSTELLNYQEVFTITETEEQVFTFTNPYISNVVVNITKDGTVQYTYEIFSWGIKLLFTGNGNVTQVQVIGDAIITEYKQLVTKQNTIDIQENGLIEVELTSDLIQTRQRATILATAILADPDVDKYSTEVEYRGDIALTLNDPVKILDGIAPTDTYRLKSHTLYWDGSLSGTGRLKT